MLYDELPEAVKVEVSRIEWIWLTHEERARLLENLTQPESDEE